MPAVALLMNDNTTCTRLLNLMIRWLKKPNGMYDNNGKVAGNLLGDDDEDPNGAQL